jgi:PHD/YefM family antitoxin component YafN of YafNO toxin-antitoxin module
MFCLRGEMNMAPVATPELEDVAVTHTRAAKDGWAQIVADAEKYGHVLVTNEDQPNVVVMPLDEYVRLQRILYTAGVAKVRAEVAKQLAVLNEPGTREAIRAFMDASPQQIAAAANAAERRDKK